MTVERHLLLQEQTLPAGAEWSPRGSGWFVVRLAEGSAYWMQPGHAAELAPGCALVLARDGQGTLRVSRLANARIQFFRVELTLLNGILTATEWQQLDSGPNGGAQALIFKSTDALAKEFTRFAESGAGNTLPARCRLLQFWAEAVGKFLTPTAEPPENGDLREQFRRLLSQMSAAELSSCSLGELAEQLHCSERHLSRLFRAEFQIPFRQRQTELRLLRASQLLADSNAKIINVAYESGYRHLGLFNTMFKKRFSMTPTQWRQKAATKSRSAKGTVFGLLLLGLISTPADATELADKVPAPEIFTNTTPLEALRQKIAALEGKPVVAPEAATRTSPPSPETSTNTTALEAVRQKIIVLDTEERRAARRAFRGTNSVAMASTNTHQAGYEIAHYNIRGNTLLSPQTLDDITADHTGGKVTFDQIKGTLAELQSEYRDRGFPTVAVRLPPQQITNASINVEVIEAPLMAINVTGNHHFNSNNVMRALPSLHTNMVLNSQVLQRELDLANANRDRQIYPMIGPGAEPGTSDLTLKVKDRLPLHGRFELNNLYTPGTPPLRMNLNAQYNNLWDYEHQVGVQYSFTPEESKSDTRNSVTLADDPLIANYSAYYRIPLSSTRSVQRQIDENPAAFGYNEATHKFNLPPPSGKPDLTFYASRSTSDTGVKLSTPELITQTAFITILSQDSGEDLTLNEGLGARLAIPFGESLGLRASLSAGVDFKRYQLESFNTNNFYITTVITNSNGSQTIENNVSNGQPVRRDAVTYLPLNLGLDVAVPDDHGTTFFNASANFNVLPGFSDDADFAQAASDTNATAHYVTFNLGLSREQKIWREWTVLLRANGQVANGPLFSNEQFALGGSQSVRGYREGEMYGDSGWRVTLEPRTPNYNLGMVDNTVPFWFRGSVFMDYGEAYHESFAGHESLWGAGCAGTATIGDHLDARLTLAWALLDRDPIRAGDFRIYFALGAQF